MVIFADLMTSQVTPVRMRAIREELGQDLEPVFFRAEHEKEGLLKSRMCGL